MPPDDGQVSSECSVCPATCVRYVLQEDNVTGGAVETKKVLADAHMPKNPRGPRRDAYALVDPVIGVLAGQNLYHLCRCLALRFLKGLL